MRAYFMGISEDLPTGSEDVSDDGLELAYNMRDLTGDGRMRDFSPNRLHGDITAAVDVGGKWGRARDFSPSASARINAPFDPAMNFTDAITVVVWARLNNIISNQQVIGRDDVAFERNWYIRWNTVNSWEFRFWTTGGNRTMFGQAGTVGALELWGGSWGSDTGEYRHWKNGVEAQAAGTFDQGGSLLGSTTIGIMLGLAASGGQPLDGEIHTALLFSRVLTASEWWSLYLDGRKMIRVRRGR